MRARGVWFIDLPRRPLIFYHGSLQIRASTKFLPPPKNTRYTVCQCYSVPLLLLIWYEVTTSINNLGCTSWQTTISLLLELQEISDNQGGYTKRLREVMVDAISKQLRNLCKITFR